MAYLYPPSVTVDLPKSYRKLDGKTISLEKVHGLGQHYNKKTLYPTSEKLFGTKSARLCFIKPATNTLKNGVIYYRPNDFQGIRYTFYCFDNEFNYRKVSIPTPKTDRDTISDQILAYIQKHPLILVFP